MTLMPAWLTKMLDPSNRWRGVELAAWTAFLLTTCSVLAFTRVTNASRLIPLGPETAVPSLLYPYLASVAVFVTTCVWILAGARSGVSHDLISEKQLARAEKWFWATFALVAVVLVLSGLAGDQGLKAAKSLNWYLFGPLDDPAQEGEWYRKKGMPFGLLTVVANALSLATLVYLGTLCNGLILGGCDDKTQQRDTVASAALRVGEAERRLKSLFVMASALMVTSTLALYLSFATADQVQVLRDAHADRLKLPGRATQSAAKASPQLLTVDCRTSTAASSGQGCTLSVPVAEKAARPAASAAYMALVAGLSFTGALFILFTACGSALSDRAAELARRQLELATAEAPFDLKAWREHNGLADTGVGAQTLQGLVLVAPALTGLLTLVNS